MFNFSFPPPLHFEKLYTPCIQLRRLLKLKLEKKRNPMVSSQFRFFITLFSLFGLLKNGKNNQNFTVLTPSFSVRFLLVFGVFLARFWRVFGSFLDLFWLVFCSFLHIFSLRVKIWLCVERQILRIFKICLSNTIYIKHMQNLTILTRSFLVRFCIYFQSGSKFGFV